ncbi:MAG: ABC transporter permease [Pseudomonadota bacterium]
MSDATIERAAVVDDSENVDLEERARARRESIDKTAGWLMPLLTIALGIWLWDRIVVWNDIKPFILPGPMRVAETLIADAGLLWDDLLQTMSITLLALVVAVVGGVGLAVLFTQSRLIEQSLSPYAVILQVTPVIAIAPLIRIYVESPTIQLLLCAWIVAFFPILSNTTLGLNSTDHNLRDLFKIYGASRWQRLRYMQLPSALPYFMGGLRIAGGLALIGAVVAEFVIGVGGTGNGLAARILESGYRLNIPRLYAALIVIALAGVAIYLITGWLSHIALRKWHESAVKRET